MHAQVFFSSISCVVMIMHASTIVFRRQTKGGGKKKGKEKDTTFTNN